MRLFVRMLLLCLALWLPAFATDIPPLDTEPSPAATHTSVAPPAQTLSPVLTVAPRMTVGRASHTATVLMDGTILIAGGFREEGTTEIAIASAEIYDPVANTFRPTGDLNQARSGHVATLLPDGQVLMVGGWGPNNRLASAELYDPVTGHFREAASLSAPRAGMTATLLPNGQVLIAGGETARSRPSLAAELYDPATGQFTLTGKLITGRSAHTATLLQDGRVLLVGGNSDADTILVDAELFDPTSSTFTPAGALSAVRYKHAAVQLADGRVLIVGGSDVRDWQGQYASAELYDPATGVFTSLPGPMAERFKLSDAILLLADGNVLIGGGSQQLELFEPASQRFRLGGMLDAAYYYSVLTPLPDNRVLITGGYDGNIEPSDKAWLYSY